MVNTSWIKLSYIIAISEKLTKKHLPLWSLPFIFFSLYLTIIDYQDRDYYQDIDIFYFFSIRHLKIFHALTMSTPN